jgi:methanogenic corrinoid protein MtbC1
MIGPTGLPGTPDVGSPELGTPDLGASHERARPNTGGLQESADAQLVDRTLQRTIETELVPRLLMAHRVGSVPRSFNSDQARRISDTELNAFIDEVVGIEDAAAPAFVRRLLDEGVSVESIYLELLAPTARELGIRWEDDECSFVDVTVALGRLQRVLRDLSQYFQAEAEAAPDSAGHVLLTCLPGEQHTLGLILVAEFLMRDGFRVLVGAPWSEEDLLTQVRTEWFDVVGFSAGCDSRLSTLKREIARIRSASRNPNVRILVGGQVFSLEQELVKRVGADGWARDAKEAPVIVRQLLEAGAMMSHSLDSSTLPGSTFDDAGPNA